jgi:hypothetical protein
VKRCPSTKPHSAPTVLHRVGEGDDIVAQLGLGDAAFWVAATSASMKRLSPRAIDGATSRTLLVIKDPDSVVRQAVAAGATESSPVNDEHGWRLGRIIGGRRGPKPSPVWLTEGADLQELREALYRTRTDDPLLAIAAGGKGFRLFSPLQSEVDLPLIATGCNHGAP